MKKLLFFLSINRMLCAMETDNADPIAKLNDLAKNGSYAAAVILAQDAYEQKKLPEWLKENGTLWPILQNIDEMALAADWFTKECRAELFFISRNSMELFRKKLKASTNDEQLAKKLFSCQELGKCVRQLEKIENINKVLEDIPELKALFDGDADFLVRDNMGKLANDVYILALKQQKERQAKKRDKDNQLKELEQLRETLSQLRQSQRTIKQCETLQRLLKLNHALSELNDIEKMMNNNATSS